MEPLPQKLQSTTTQKIQSTTSSEHTNGAAKKIFISKHEAKGKHLAENIAIRLEQRGYSCWLSQWEEDVDADSMQRGVDNADALLLVMTPGIFHKDREWVTHTEVKYAIDSKKPILLVDGGFRFEKMTDTCGHLKECCVDVRPDFQPYARALVKALEIVKWTLDKDIQQISLNKLEAKFENRQNEAAKLHKYLAREVQAGRCTLQRHGESKNTEIVSSTVINVKAKIPTAEHAYPPNEQWVRLSRPLLGKNARKLPDIFDERIHEGTIDVEQVVVDIAKAASSSSTLAFVGFKGQGGVGKSVLASWVLKHDTISHVFGERIVWIQAGQTVERRELLLQIAQCALGIAFIDPNADKRPKKKPGVSSRALFLKTEDRPASAVPEEDIFEVFDEFFLAQQDRPILFVVDDLWKDDHLRLISRAVESHPCCTMLITTRDRACLPEMCTCIDVKRLTEASALKLLEAHSGTFSGDQEKITLAKEVAKLCGYVPVALKVIGSVARKCGWKRLKARMVDIDRLVTEREPERFRRGGRSEINAGGGAGAKEVYGGREVELAFTAGIDAEWLPEGMDKQYLLLGAFGEDTDIPLKALHKLWGFEEEDDDGAEMLARQLDDASLLEYRVEEGITPLTWRCVNPAGSIIWRNSMKLDNKWTMSKNYGELQSGDTIDVLKARCGKDKNWLKVRLNGEHGIKYLPISRPNGDLVMMAPAVAEKSVWLHNLQHVFVRKRARYDKLFETKDNFERVLTALLLQAQWTSRQGKFERAGRDLAASVFCELTLSRHTNDVTEDAESKTKHRHDRFREWTRDVGTSVLAIPGIEALVFAVVWGNHVKVMQGLLALGLDVNNMDVVGMFGELPLHGAVVRGNVEMLDVLIGVEGTDVNASTTDKDARTPLILACINFRKLSKAYDSHGIVSCLLRHPDIDVNKGSLAYGTTSNPLYYASRHGQIDIVRLLLERDNIVLNPIVRIHKYRCGGCCLAYDTTWEAAVHEGHTEILDLLFSRFRHRRCPFLWKILASICPRRVVPQKPVYVCRVDLTWGRIYLVGAVLLLCGFAWMSILADAIRGHQDLDCSPGLSIGIIGLTALMAVVLNVESTLRQTACATLVLLSFWGPVLFGMYFNCISEAHVKHFEFQMIYSGRCDDTPGYTWIKDEQTCVEASWHYGFDFEFIFVGDHHRHVRGCYHNSTALWFNYNSSGALCGTNNDTCICSNVEY